MVDILMATYNGEKYIAEQIESLLQQSYQDFRVLIRDDGSTDSTLAIIEKFCSDYPDRIFLMNDDVVCGSSASNFIRLLNYAESDYAMFCDQDDVWLPNKVQCMLDFIQANDNEGTIPVLAYGDYIPVDSNLVPMKFNKKDNQVYNEKLDINHLLVQNYVTGCTCIFNKALYSNTLIYDERILMHDWWLALYAVTFGKLLHNPVELMYYRQHSDNCVGVKNIRSFNYLITKLFDKDIKKSFEMYIMQAEAFDQMFGKEFEDNCRNIFYNFIALQDENKISRIATIIKGKYYKSTFARILGEFYAV